MFEPEPLDPEALSLCRKLAMLHFEKNPADPRSLSELELFYLQLPYTENFCVLEARYGPAEALLATAYFPQAEANRAIARAMLSPARRGS